MESKEPVAPKPVIAFAWNTEQLEEYLSEKYTHLDAESMMKLRSVDPPDLIASYLRRCPDTGYAKGFIREHIMQKIASSWMNAASVPNLVISSWPGSALNVDKVIDKMVANTGTRLRQTFELILNEQDCKVEELPGGLFFPLNVNSFKECIRIVQIIYNETNSTLGLSVAVNGGEHSENVPPRATLEKLGYAWAALPTFGRRCALYIQDGRLWFLSPSLDFIEMVDTLTSPNVSLNRLAAFHGTLLDVMVLPTDEVFILDVITYRQDSLVQFPLLSRLAYVNSKTFLSKSDWMNLFNLVSGWQLVQYSTMFTLRPSTGGSIVLTPMENAYRFGENVAQYKFSMDNLALLQRTFNIAQ